MSFLKSVPRIFNMMCPLSSEDWTARPLSIIIWGVTGTMLTAEVLYIAAVYRSHSQMPALSTDEGKLMETNRAEGTVLHYWLHLSEAICAAPRATTIGIGEAADIDAPVPDAAPEAVQRIWNGEADYSIATQEVLSLLQRHRSVGLGDDAIAAASLAVLWRMQCVRSIYSSVVHYGDAQRCEDDLDMLKDYTSWMFNAFIRPFTKGDNKLGKALAMCWKRLSDVLQVLMRMRRKVQAHNLWCLAKYLFDGATGRAIETSLIFVFAGIATCNESYGSSLRKHIEKLLRAFFRSRSLKVNPQRGDGHINSNNNNNNLDNVPSSININNNNNNNGGSNGGVEVSADIGDAEVYPSVIMGLLTFELMRLAASVALTNLVSNAISFAVTRHRERAKEKLYVALAHTPISYFDTHGMDEVEEMIHYPNDLEGVDLRVRVLTIRTAQVVIPFLAFHRRGCLLAFGTVAVNSLFVRLTNFLKRKYGKDLAEVYNDGDDWGESDSLSDAEEGENGNVAKDGAMLRGMEIITRVHELRPYAADATLMAAWNAQQRRRQERQHARVVCRSFRRTFRPRRIWACQSTSMMFDWLVPALTEAYAAVTFLGGVDIADVIKEARKVVEVVHEGFTVSDVVMRNAHKASVLERVMDPKHWENAATEEENDEEEEEEERETDGRDTLHQNSNDDDEDNNNNDNTIIANIQANSMKLCGIRATNVQFRYPSAPSVDAYRAPLSFSAELRGKFVCLAGASGFGKTTTLRLLLGLYNSSDGELELRFTRRGEAEESWVSIKSVSRRVLRRRLFSYVPQEPMLLPGATIAQNVSMHNRVSVADAAVLRRVRDCVVAADCGEFVDRYPQGLLTPLAGAGGWTSAGAVRLSSGQARRMMLARALYHGGSVLLMDEPTAGLDEAARKTLTELWRGLLKEGRVHGVLCVTHDGDLLREADEVIHL